MNEWMNEWRKEDSYSRMPSLSVNAVGIPQLEHHFVAFTTEMGSGNFYEWTLSRETFQWQRYMMVLRVSLRNGLLFTWEGENKIYCSLFWKLLDFYQMLRNVQTYDRVINTLTSNSYKYMNIHKSSNFLGQVPARDRNNSWLLFSWNKTMSFNNNNNNNIDVNGSF